MYSLENQALVWFAHYGYDIAEIHKEADALLIETIKLCTNFLKQEEIPVVRDIVASYERAREHFLYD